MTGGRDTGPANWDLCPPWRLSEQQLREKLAAGLDIGPNGSGFTHRPVPDALGSTRGRAGSGVPSDYDLNPGMREDEGGGQTLRRAAVLIPIIFKPDPVILFTLRPEQLKYHGGQISFPGGKVDSGDRDATATALREIREELGIDDRHIEPFGFVDFYETRTGFLIAPLIAILKPGFEIKPDSDEVKEVFEVPFEHLMDPKNLRKHAGTLNGKTRYYHALPFKTRYIWGATAGILVNMQQRLFG